MLINQWVTPRGKAEFRPRLMPGSDCRSHEYQRPFMQSIPTLSS